MEEIIRILMNRDGLSREEAEEQVSECKKDLHTLIEDGNIEDAYHILEEYFSLEIDYLPALLCD